MTTYAKTALKAFFEQGDIPTGTNYADLIDSQVNIAEPTNQAMAGPLTSPKLISPLVSANAINANILTVASANINGGNLSIPGGTVFANNGSFLGSVVTSAVGMTDHGFQSKFGANTNGSTFNAYEAIATNFGSCSILTGFNFHTISLASAAVVGTINAINITAPSFSGGSSAGTMRALNIANLGINGQLNSSVAISIAQQVGATTTNTCINAANSTFVVDGSGALLTAAAIVSAAGTTFGTGATMPNNNIVRGRGTADGTATGFTLLSGKAGLVTQFVHEGVVSGNLWPAGTDYQINALTSGSPFPLAANTLYTVVYKTASAYAVK